MLSSNDLTIAAAAGYFDAYKLDRLRILYLTSTTILKCRKLSNITLQILHLYCQQLWFTGFALWLRLY